MKIRKWHIWTLVAVLMVIAILVALPKWKKDKEVRQLNHCISNMCFINSGREQYEWTHPGLTNGTVITREQLKPYIKGDWDFVCHTAGKDTYSIGRVGEEVSCSVHGSFMNEHFPSGRPLH
jgi:hypothetical protein